MIAVTTHSRAKGPRSAVAMALAGRLITRELRDAPGCERYANVIAGPREFWTLTIWQDDAALRTCMRAGTHGKVRWQQPYWLDCYWGMRWRPGDHGSGAWEGRAWRWPHTAQPAGEQQAEPAGLPVWIRAALGQTASVDQRRVDGTAGVTYRLRVPPWRLPAALRDLRLLRGYGARDPDVFRHSLGFGTGGALYLLIVANSVETLGRLRDRPQHERVVRRWGDRLWVSTWEPDSEFGHWDGGKLREGRLAAAPLVLDVRLPGHADAARRARESLRAGLPMLDPESVDSLELLTSELVSNGVRHAGLGPSDRIGLKVRLSDSLIRVEVHDRGRRFEPRVPLAKSAEDQSGWGLYILDRMSDRWGVVDGPRGRLLWSELRLPLR
jgi:Anti-sigma regulatory factor (Ser/Thr protein kinase)